VTLRLPFGPSDEAPAQSVAMLNRLEAYGSGALDLQGTWCVAPTKPADTLAFNAFYPNIFRRNGLAKSIAMKMARRAEWAASLTDGKTRESRWLVARPAIKRIFEEDPGTHVLQCESCQQVVIVSQDRLCPSCGREVRLPS
jgi:hypothetical protein